MTTYRETKMNTWKNRRFCVEDIISTTSDRGFLKVGFKDFDNIIDSPFGVGHTIDLAISDLIQDLLYGRDHLRKSLFGVYPDDEFMLRALMFSGLMSHDDLEHYGSYNYVSKGILKWRGEWRQIADFQVTRTNKIVEVDSGVHVDLEVIKTTDYMFDPKGRTTKEEVVLGVKSKSYPQQQYNRNYNNDDYDNDMYGCRFMEPW